MTFSNPQDADGLSGGKGLLDLLLIFSVSSVVSVFLAALVKVVSDSIKSINFKITARWRIRVEHYL